MESRTCCCSVTQLCPTFCDPVDCSMLALPVLHHLLEFAQIHVLHQWCHPASSSSNTLVSFCPPSFPVSGTFSVSHLFISDDQNTGASASVSVPPVNIQSWYPLRLPGLISLLSKRLSGVFPSTTIWRHQFFDILSSLQFSSHNLTWPLGRP